MQIDENHNTIFKKFSQGYHIHVQNLKRIRPVVAELYSIENTGAGSPFHMNFLLCEDTDNIDYCEH